MVWMPSCLTTWIIYTTYVMVVNCTMGMDVSSRGLTLTTSVSSSMRAILDLLNLVTTV